MYSEELASPLAFDSRSSQPTTTIEYPPPDYSEVNSAAPADILVEHSTDQPQELPLPSNFADGVSISEFSQPYVKEARSDLLSVDIPIVQAMQKDIMVVPLHSDVPIGQNVGTTSASLTTVFGSRKQAGNIKPDRESNNICPYDIRSWRFGIPIANAETGAPDICWCKQCFQSGPLLDNRICFGTSDGYVEVWTDKPKASIFSSSPSFCFCRTIPFYVETVTKYDFYKANPQNLRDNSPRRQYLLNCRSFYILSTKDSRFRKIDSGSAQICSKGSLQTPPSGHLRQSSAPENNAHLLGEDSQSAKRANHVTLGIPDPPKISSDVSCLTPESKPAQFNVSINPKPPVLPKEMCWCGDFCWVTKVRRARTDQSAIRLACRSGTEIGHRVFFSSTGGEIEVWTDLPKPKNAFTGVEKPTCKMAPRHISRVVKVDMYTDRLTQSAPKRVHLLNCRESANYSTLIFERSSAWNGSTTFLVKEDTMGKDDVSALKDCGLHEEGGRLTTSSSRREESPNFLSSGLLQPPQIGHQRRSSAPETLGNKTEPPTQSSRAKYYRLANGKIVILRMPPGDISSPHI
ncbi:uncharacterized protein A1O9_05041 [Exophiala aquamarina CBS 119918]|uniref:Uncharacterized protein n=1 Tax=Exophiala aquamarina CBS 119918 TaxID=1182545 RepID=A0A072PJY1_9EURO|nr:uncharacterized protein A1O9_05041 [Exophiala aquamarina CBS 119918]KEF60191.1 hypothetical protein A1O9_05041 [Exophiala aquamarina CBS 119918]